MAELYNVFFQAGELLLALWALALYLVTHFWALALWVVYWLFFVRWPMLKEQLQQGAWVGIVLLYFLICFTWGVCTESSWTLFGVPLSSVQEKFLFGTVAVVLALMCGWLQELWNLAPQPVEIAGPPEEPAPVAHGHDH